MKLLQNKKGFTLIELLVVIGILGILAAGLLATVDPLEQFRKGQDSNGRTASVELVNALARYNAAKGVMPWASVASGGAACNGGAAPSGLLANAASFSDCFTALESSGEIKTQFRNGSIISKLNVTGATSGGIVCFQPQSKSLKGNIAETKYTNTGGACTPAANPETANTCYWCAQ